MQITVLHPAISDNASLEDRDTLVQVEAISATLKRFGHDAVPLPFTLDLAAMRDSLLWLRPDLIFNLSESVDGADSLQYVPTAVLDVIGIPYTGNSTEAIFQTTHKLLAKQVLGLAGLPTPAWLAEGNHCSAGVSSAAIAAAVAAPQRAAGTATAQLHPPCIVKAVWEHASRGLDDQNVVLDGGQAAVRTRLREHFEQSRRPCFAEQFIEGREFNVPILDGPDGPQVLPVGEIDFSDFPADKPRIVGHRAKWHEDSFEYNHTPRRFDSRPEDGALLERLRDLTLDCWRLFGLRGYARVDFRVDDRGQPWVLEVNTNPCLSPDAGFAAAVVEAGLTFEQAVQRIVDVGIRV